MCLLLVGESALNPDISDRGIIPFTVVPRDDGATVLSTRAYSDAVADTMKEFSSDRHK